MSDRVGQQIGDYPLVRLIGKGGFAGVYLGEPAFTNASHLRKMPLNPVYFS